MKQRKRAAIYCRISRDPEGLRAGVERQQEDCEALARREGYEVAQVYVDNDISASTLSQKSRPQYTAMIEGAQKGEFDAIIAYSNSRLTRRLLELESLIRLHEAHGTRIVTVVSGEDNLSTADGRMVARIKASVDSAEAERTGERIRRAHLQRARSGATNHGGRPFGWADDKLALDPREARLIREAAQQVISGVPLRVIARQWNDSGIRTSRGGEWTHTTLRRMLQRPRLVGIRTHQGKVLLDASGSPVRGVWEPLLDQDTFDRVQAVFAADGRGVGRKGSRKYLLTGTLRCGVCGGRMHGGKTPTSYAYLCDVNATEHSLGIQGPKTDQMVLDVVRARLASVELPEVQEDAPPAPERLEGISRMISELMDAYRAGRLSAALVFPQIEELEAERAQLQADRAAMIKATATPARPTVEDLDKLDVDRQRAVMSTLLDAVVVAPAKRRGSAWTPDRLTYVWRQS